MRSLFFLFLSLSPFAPVYGQLFQNATQSCKAYYQPRAETRLQIDHLGILASANRYDVFAGPVILASRNRLNLDAALMLGIQQLDVGGFYPRVRLGAGYNLINRVSIQLGPTLFLATSSINPTGTTHGRLYDYEMLGGYKLMLFAGRLKLFHSIGGGLTSRSVFNTVVQKRTYTSGFGYALCLGLVYEL